MLTFFTTAKPFQGHDSVIQRNALQSWKLLHPEVEVILFGDDDGAAEICTELGLRHEPDVARHESGVKYVNYMFDHAQKIAQHDYLCYSNCDIVLTQDFWKAFEVALSWKKRFLFVAQRWDTDVTEPIDFSRPDWADRLRKFALTNGFQQDPYWIDFFLFSRGLFVDMPPLLVGHCGWDTWMIWKALSDDVPILDGSRILVPIHQNHGYCAAFGRSKGVATDPLSMLNLELIGGRGNIRPIKSSTHRFTSDNRIAFNWSRYTYQYARLALKLWQPLIYKVWLPSWHSFLGITRPVRSVLRLRSKVMRSR